jgi:general secretion pathway protein A
MNSTEFVGHRAIQANRPPKLPSLCDHAAGNYRIFIGMAAELLMTPAQREITKLDEKLYLQVFAPPETQTRRAAAAR